MFTNGKLESSAAVIGTLDETSARNGASRKRCSDCNHLAPPTDTNFTLISSQHGWRLSFETDESGRRLSIWRCPRCWKAHKAALKQAQAAR